MLLAMLLLLLLLLLVLVPVQVECHLATIVDLVPYLPQLEFLPKRAVARQGP
jgi:hypothetical protein